MTHEQDPNARPLPPMSELFSDNVLRLIGENKTKELERILTEQGLRDLARSRTIYILSYMDNPLLNYGKGDWFNFKRLLLAQMGEEDDVIDPTTFWNALDQQRISIALDEIGKTVGVDINERSISLKQGIETNQTTDNSISLETNNHSYNVMIIYKNEGFEYRFVKMVD